jgi:hypothetical protein
MLAIDADDDSSAGEDVRRNNKNNGSIAQSHEIMLNLKNKKR